MQTALKLDGIGKRYGDFEAVRDLSFEVPEGRICGFLGPNGAGKTSTIRMILGLVEPTSGKLSVLGAGDGRSVRSRIGFLPEERGLYRRMTPVEAITFLASLKGLTPADAKRRAIKLLEENNLGHAMKRQIRSLSKGMAQKVQLLSAIAHEPELVILDEPFSGLDPVNQQELEGLIRGLAARGATVLFSTHVMQHAERLCEQVILMSRGRKVFDGIVDQARTAAPGGGLAPVAAGGHVLEPVQDRLRLQAVGQPGQSGHAGSALTRRFAGQVADDPGGLPQWAGIVGEHAEQSAPR